ncbi:MAG: cytochrome d ubiquinol oxidase subunit II [Planctomycetaceae bacterium]
MMTAYDWYTYIWFVLLGILLVGYTILDGFDFGVGMLHPWVARNDTDRRLVMNSIGPLWDGNEVWLVTFGGALFAAFPVAYATVFSSFYIAFHLLLACLIGRAISLEFRSKASGRWWRRYWDFSFFLSSLVASMLLGVAAGNVLQGMELGAKYRYEGSLLGQLTWYPLLVGGLTTSLFAMHGAIFLYLKTEGELQQRVSRAILPLWAVFAAMYLVVSIATFRVVPHATENIHSFPILWIVPILNVLAVLNIPRAMHLAKPGYAFFSSSMIILALASLFSVAIFPYLVISSLDPAYSIDVYNARSSQTTLGIMLVVAMIGMPFVISYTAIVYWIFRGKVKLDKASY